MSNKPIGIISTDDRVDTGAADPFGDDDPFDSARDSFPNAEWVIDRLVLVWPMELLTGLKGNTGNLYDSMVCRIVVLDGPATEDMPKIPCEIVPFRFNADGIISDLKHLVGSSKPKLARVKETPSKANPKIMARFFAAPDDADKGVARKYLATQLHS